MNGLVVITILSTLLAALWALWEHSMRAQAEGSINVWKNVAKSRQEHIDWLLKDWSKTNQQCADLTLELQEQEAVFAKRLRQIYGADTERRMRTEAAPCSQ